MSLIKSKVLLCRVVLLVFAKDSKRTRTVVSEDDSVDKMRAAMIRQLAESPPKDVHQEVSISLPIQFQFGSSNLTDNGMALLIKAAKVMNSNELQQYG